MTVSADCLSQTESIFLRLISSKLVEVFSWIIQFVFVVFWKLCISDYVLLKIVLTEIC